MCLDISKSGEVRSITIPIPPHWKDKHKDFTVAAFIENLLNTPDLYETVYAKWVEKKEEAIKQNQGKWLWLMKASVNIYIVVLFSHESVPD